MALTAGSRLGPYEILLPLGAGGMGEVYRARDTRLSREVAIKVMPQEFAEDSERLSRFEQEARAASALNHPNIVTLYDVGKFDGGSYIAMELVEGRTLRELLQEGPLALRRALALSAQLADGLAKAHAIGIVHRDLKPENLMVTREGFLKILDFGLAKLAAPSDGALSGMLTAAQSTRAGWVVGTAGYMSPEQASGKPVDFRSDQFSLGAILYEMLAGRRAFAGETAVETLAAIVRQEPPALGQIQPSIPQPLQWIVERCLAKDPEERYASTRDLAQDLRVIQEHTSGQAAVTAPVARRSAASRLGFVALIAAAAVAGGFVLARITKAPTPAHTLQRLTFRRGTVWSARFAPDGQTVVYSAAWEGNPVELYETRVGSAESRPLHLGKANVLSISSGGEMALSLEPRFVFSYLRPGTLARAPLTGGAPRENLTDVNSADWTPDGKELAVAVGDPKGTRLECPVGQPLFQSEGIVGKVRVSPDGQWLAFWDYVGQSAQVGIVPRKGGARRVLSGGWRVWSVGLAWSADGREVWFTATRGELQNALYAVDLSGHIRLVSRFPSGLELFDIGLEGRVLAASVSDRVGLITLAPDSVRERDLSWLDTSFLAGFSTDGRMVAFTEFAASREEGAQLYLRRTDGSPAIRLGEGFVLGFGEISPDGQWVIAAAARPPLHLILVPSGTGSPHDVANGPIERYVYNSIRWLPDSRRFVFIGSERDRRERLYIGDLGGGVPRPIGPPDANLQPSGLAVSPDGTWAAAIAAEGTRVSLYSIEGGAARPVPGSLNGDLLIGWSADRNSLYTYRIGDLPAQIYQIAIETGDRRKLREISAADPAGVWRIHPIRITADGRSCAYSYARRLSDLYVFEGLR